MALLTDKIIGKDKYYYARDDERQPELEITCTLRMPLLFQNTRGIERSNWDKGPDFGSYQKRNCKQ